MNIFTRDPDDVENPYLDEEGTGDVVEDPQPAGIVSAKDIMKAAKVAKKKGAKKAAKQASAKKAAKKTSAPAKKTAKKAAPKAAKKAAKKALAKTAPEAKRAAKVQLKGHTRAGTPYVKYESGKRRGPGGGGKLVRRGDVKYGARVHKARTAKGLTQAGLGAKTKMTQGHCANIEKGTVCASAELKARIKKVLGV